MTTGARIISIVNQKGGVGKTTTAVNLAAGLVMEGKKVLLIDIDAQANATSGLGLRPEELQQSTYDVLVDETPIADIVQQTELEGLHVAPSSMDVAGAAVELVPVMGREFRLQRAVQVIAPQYDFILIDCPPSLGIITLNGIVASDEILIPVQAEYYALEGLGQLLQTIQIVKEHLKPTIHILGAVLTMYDRRNKLAQDVFRDLYQNFPNTVFRTLIPRTVRLAEAPSYGKPIMLHDPSSKGTRVYHKLAREVIITDAAFNPREQLFEPTEESTNTPTTESYE